MPNTKKPPIVDFSIIDKKQSHLHVQVAFPDPNGNRAERRAVKKMKRKKGK